MASPYVSIADDDTVNTDRDYCECDVTVESPLKPEKKKRLCRFQTPWEEQFSWSQKVAGNIYEAHCKVCMRKFSIAHGRRNDMTAHPKADLHLKSAAAAKSSSVASFFVR